MRAQSERLRRPDGRLLLPPDPSRAVPADGPLVRSGPARAHLAVTTWPSDALERVVLGDHSGWLDAVVLPEPSDPGAPAAVAGLVRVAAARLGPARAGRTQLWLRWPATDTAMTPLLAGAGMTVDAHWCDRPADPLPGRPHHEVTVRPAGDDDAATVAELAVEEVRYHVALTPFTRDLPVAGVWARDTVLVADPARPVLVAERNGRVVGYAACELVDTPDDGLVRPRPPGRAGHLRSVAVTASERGRGVGSALAHGACAYLVAAGAGMLSLAFVPGNPTGEPFWLGLGFRPLWSYWATVVGDVR